MSEYKNCPYCNRTITSDATVCKHCGKQLASQSVSVDIETMEEEGNPSALFIVLGILACVLTFLPNARNMMGISMNNYYANVAKNATATNTTGNTVMPNMATSKMSPIDNNLMNVLEKKGYKNYSSPNQKLVLYTNVVDLQCPYQEAFLKAIYGYKSSPDWTKKYNFIEIQQHQKESLSYNSMEEAKEDEVFRNSTYPFCIVDFSNNTYFHGDNNDPKYLYQTLYSLYNE